MKYRLLGRLIRATPRTKTVELVISAPEGTFNVVYWADDKDEIAAIAEGLKFYYNKDLEITGTIKLDKDTKAVRIYARTISEPILTYKPKER
mgnify:CR=1 FL=1